MIKRKTKVIWLIRIIPFKIVHTSSQKNPLAVVHRLSKKWRKQIYYLLGRPGTFSSTLKTRAVARLCCFIRKGPIEVR